MLIKLSDKPLMAEVSLAHKEPPMNFPVDTAWKTERGIAWVNQGYTGVQPTMQAHFVEGPLSSENPWLIRLEDITVLIRVMSPKEIAENSWESPGEARALEYLLGWNPDLQGEAIDSTSDKKIAGKSKMLKFNTLLREAEIDPKTVRLVRHQDSRIKMSLWGLWKEDRRKFDDYQSVQRKNRFKDARYIASFVVNAIGETIFVGLYEIKSVSEVPERLNRFWDPYEDVSNCSYYELEITSHLDGHLGLIVIDWGASERAWMQLAHKQNKDVLEIRREIKEPEFPGFFEFRKKLDELEMLPFAWKEVLKSVNGIYLLVNLDTGKQYVGSAYGEEGLWGRWISYAKTGHGHNLEMMKLDTWNYQVSILEVFPPNVTIEEVVQSESRWKEVLKSREFGLNAN